MRAPAQQDYFTTKVYSLGKSNRRDYVSNMAVILVAISEGVGDAPDTIHFGYPIAKLCKKKLPRLWFENNNLKGNI